MDQQVVVEAKKRGPKVEKIVEPITTWPEDLKTKLKARLVRYGAKIIASYKTVGSRSTVYHVEVKYPDGSIGSWRNAHAPEWDGWIAEQFKD